MIGSGIKKHKLSRSCTLWLLCFFLSFTISAQQKNYLLKGTAKVKDGDTYPYQASLIISGTAVTGSSVTIQPDGTRLRAAIKGRLNTQRHTLSFTETATIGQVPGDVTTCMFSVSLSYRLQNGNYLFSGTFTGKDNLGMLCGSGIMQFQQPAVPGSAFAPPVARTSIPVRDSTPSSHPTNDNKVTEGIDKQLEWHTDKCLVEVWDGGVIDGDVVTIKLNDKEILSDYTLTRDKKQIWLQLTGKINTITIIAGDEGSAPPNTAQMMLTDGAEQHKITTYNKKGKTARVILIRQSP